MIQDDLASTDEGRSSYDGSSIMSDISGESELSSSIRHTEIRTGSVTVMTEIRVK